MIQLRVVLLAATLCFLLGVFALSGQAACHSVACKGNLGSTSKSSSRGSRFHIVKTPFIHRRADAKPTSLEVVSEDTADEAPSTSFLSTESATSFPEFTSTTPIRSSQIASARETGNPPSLTTSSSLLSSVSTSPTNEGSSSSLLTSDADSTLTEDFSSSSPVSLPRLRATSNPFSLEQILTSDSSSIIYGTAGSFSTDPDIPRTTYNATSNDHDGNSNEKLQEAMPFIIVLAIMIAIGLCTGIRCALRGRQRRRRQYDAESQKSLQFSSGIEKDGESYGWVDGHTTSRRMWSMMASRKGIKQKVIRPLGRRRAISESSIPRQSTATSFLSPPVMSYVDVGFGIMITDEPEQQGSSDPEQRMDGPTALAMSRSSPDIRRKPSRRVTGDYLVHTPSRPSPLRHSYLTP